MSGDRPNFWSLKPDHRAIRLANGSVIHSRGLGSTPIMAKSSHQRRSFYSYDPTNNGTSLRIQFRQRSDVVSRHVVGGDW